MIIYTKYNVRSLSDWAQRSIEHYTYTPYGKRTVDTRWVGNNRSTSPYGNYKSFTGRYLDKETGLYYFRARYYDAEQGRFISRDPAGYVDGMGLYNGYFAMGFALDPSGLTIKKFTLSDSYKDSFFGINLVKVSASAVVSASCGSSPSLVSSNFSAPSISTTKLT